MHISVRWNVLEWRCILLVCTLSSSLELGNTVKEIDVSTARVFSKSTFSMVTPQVEEVLAKEEERRSVVLLGIEVGCFGNCKLKGILNFNY